MADCKDCFFTDQEYCPYFCCYPGYFKKNAIKKYNHSKK